MLRARCMFHTQDVAPYDAFALAPSRANFRTHDKHWADCVSFRCSPGTCTGTCALEPGHPASLREGTGAPTHHGCPSLLSSVAALLHPALLLSAPRPHFAQSPLPESPRTCLRSEPLAPKAGLVQQTVQIVTTHDQTLFVRPRPTCTRHSVSMDGHT